ncbi:MAG: rhodanese-like domain-containing protein [Buchananella hordeovulneris]|nr:rhodanese-like domain-containing protein [Buchananella hordeovulneris]
MPAKPLRLLASAAALVATASLAACSAQPESAQDAAPAPADNAAVAENAAPAADQAAAQAVIIDVRTPEEYAAGHLQGAINIDVSGADFATKIAELDPAGSYVVYCRSGRRSGIALDQMKALGFTDVTNAGGLADAGASLGLPTVTD